MSISAKDVGELRKATGAGLMDCKKALQESDGDYEGALDWLRKKGSAVAAKRADREANEGVVVTVLNDAGNDAVVMALSCETDFVAKNDDFVAFAQGLAQAAMDQNINTKEDMLALQLDGSSVGRQAGGADWQDW